jgi:hypothetical protein
MITGNCQKPCQMKGSRGHKADLQAAAVRKGEVAPYDYLIDDFRVPVH